MYAHVQSLKTLPDYTMDLVFVGGERRLYDFKPLMKRFDCFQSFQKNKGLFEKAQIDVGGYGIIWGDELDIDASELFFNGKKNLADVTDGRTPVPSGKNQSKPRKGDKYTARLICMILFFYN